MPSACYPDLSVAEVRRALSELRKLWHAARSSGKESRPMYLVAPLGVKGLTAQVFAFQFLLSHHTKRSTPTSPALEETPPEEL